MALNHRSSLVDRKLIDDVHADGRSDHDEGHNSVTDHSSQNGNQI